MHDRATLPDDRRYSTEHIWVRHEDSDRFVIGITGFAHEQLGDVLYVELPKVGQRIHAGKTFGMIESAKAASDLVAPLMATVVAVNESLDREPTPVNDSPYGDGWLVKVQADNPADLEQLLNAEEYRDLVGE